MNTTIIDKSELYGVMQFVNLVSVNFAEGGTWIVAPVLCADEDSVEIFYDGYRDTIPSKVGDVTVFKFRRGHDEYYVCGEIKAIGDTCPAGIRIHYNEITKYDNLRQHTRLETCEAQAVIKDSSGAVIIGCIKNISLGGMLVNIPISFEIGTISEIEIRLVGENVIKVSGRIVRKTSDVNSNSYGVQFLDIHGNGLRLLEIEIARMEMEKFKALKLLRKNVSSSDAIYFDKVAIISYDEGESYEVREALVRMGAENFDIFHDFKYYADYFNDIDPKIIIIDTSYMNDSIRDIIMKVNKNHKDRYILLSLPFELYKNGEYADLEGLCNSALYKPFIFNEFEEEMIKYL